MIGGLETLKWTAGQRRADQRLISIPCDLPQGEYPLLIGMNTANTGDHPALVPVAYTDGTPVGSYFYLTTITVTSNGLP